MIIDGIRYKQKGRNIFKWDGDEFQLTSLTKMPEPKKTKALTIEEFSSRVIELDKKRKASIVPEIIKPPKTKKVYKRKSQAKPREEWLIKKGNELKQAKLDIEKVIYIREAVKEKNMKKLAIELNVHYRTIQSVVYGRTWKHVS